jgi:hypothetical protein
MDRVEIRFGKGWVPVVHICKPSYSGSRDQEDQGSKPAWGNSSVRPYLKKDLHKNSWWSGSRCRV